MNKAWAVLRAGVQHRLAYGWEVLGRAVFLLLLLFIYRQLYARVLPEGSALAGFDAAAVFWYLVLTESILLGAPRIEGVIDQEVKSGQLAAYLCRPMHYVAYHRWRYLGECLAAFPVNMLAGGLLGLFLVGLPDTDLAGILLGPVAILLGFLVSFQLSMTLALMAFWVEDATPFFWVYQKLLFILGGLLIPLEFYPALLRQVADALPFAVVLHGPARLVLAFDWATFGWVVARQLGWLLVLGLVTHAIFELGERRVTISGG